MHIRAILLASLAALPQAACTRCGDNKPQPFDLDESLDAEQLADFETWLSGDTGAPGDAAEATCRELCDYAARYLSGDGGDELTVDDCSHSVDPTAGTATVACSGTVQYYCEGRRPHGHCESALPSGSLGDVLAALTQLEAASVPAFEELATQLTAWGAPAALIARARSAAEDERRHTRWMAALARRHGGEVKVADRQPVASVSLREAAIHNAREGCVAETFAALVAHHRARHAHAPRLRAVFARVARDETAHAQLAWDVHMHLMDALAEADRRQVEAARRAALAALPERAARMAETMPIALGAGKQELVGLAEQMVERLAA